MKTRNRLALTVCVALAGAWLSMPASAQGLSAQIARINALGDAGKYAEAIPLAEALVARLEKSPASRDYAGALNNLAELYRSVGRDADAEPLYKRAIAIMEKAVGLNSVDIAPELNNLAALYQRQGRHAEAEPLFKRALALSEKSLPPGHPDVGRALNNLATHYEKQDRHADSEPLFRRALAIYEKAAGPDSPAVATLLNNLGQVLKAEGREADAEPMIKRSLVIREKVLGHDHPDVARSLNNLADLYQRQGRYADAEPLFKRALAIREAAVGADHPDTIASINNLASLYQAEGRTADALPLVEPLIANGSAQLGVALPVLLAAQRQQLISIEKAMDGAQRHSARHPIVRRLRCEQARRAACCRQRSPRRIGAAGPGSGERGGDARQGDRRCPLQGCTEARRRLRAAKQGAARSDCRRARRLAKDACRRIPRLCRAVQPAAGDACGNPGAVVRRRSHGAVFGR
jgi:tetratricopeptide (TPR) repeat protein